MPSLAATTIPAVKSEKSSGLDVPESFKSIVTVVEKKCRNLEKRKTKLDGYREELAKGKGLAEDQKLAVARYEEVLATLDLSREFIAAFDKIAAETSKEEKKRKKREIFEKQQVELIRFKELFTIQEVFNCLCCKAARDDFLNGFRGAPQLNEAEILKLDTFFRLVSIDRQNLPGSFMESVSNTATYFQHLLEGRNKEVAGSTYRELKELIMRIVDNGYFDWKPQPDPEPVPEEPQQPEVVETPLTEVPEAVHEESTPSTLAEIPEACPPAHMNSGIELVEPVPIPVMPQVPAATYFPVDAETNFNFIQESMINEQEPVMPINSVPIPVPTAVPASLASMDSAVVMVHSQVPPHFYMSGNPAGPPMYAPHAPLVAAQSMLHPAAIPSIDLAVAGVAPIDASISDLSAVSAATEPAVQVEKKQNHHASNPPWDEEPADDMIPYQEQPRNESNTWTNSNYRPNDQESNGRRGGYRGRGNGHQRGGPRGGGGGGFSNSRNYADRNHHQGNAGGYQGNAERYQGNNGEQRNNYQGNNGEQRNNYQGNNAGGYRPNRGPHAPRGGFRGAPRGGAFPDRNGVFRGSSRGGFSDRNAAPPTKEQ